MPFKLEDISPLQLLASFVAAFITYVAGRAVSRVYFSPLSNFPGPKFAAATYLYEFYYDWWLGGQYIFEIERLHKKYGESNTMSPTSTVLNCTHSAL